MMFLSLKVTTDRGWKLKSGAFTCCAKFHSSLRIESLMINKKPFQSPHKYCELCLSIYTSVCLELGALPAYLVRSEVFASTSKS
jgi:hypothetical protein